MSKRQRTPRFEDETTIVIRGSSTSSAFYLVLALGFLVGAGFIVVGAASGDPDDQGVTLLIAIASLPFTASFAASLIWRLIDKSPLFQADRAGLRLHPSILFQPLPWANIKSISLQDSPMRGLNTKDVRILLRDPARGVMTPFGTREIRLSLRGLFLSQRDGADLLRQLRRLRSDLSPVTKTSSRLDLGDQGLGRDAP